MGRWFIFCLVWVISFCSYNVDCLVTEENYERMFNASNSALIPTMAAVRSTNIQGSFHLCGGFLINKHWVGTAAQCLTHQTIYNTVVAVGTTSITAGVLFKLSNITKHHNYNNLTLMNDIALLRTLNEIQFTANIRPMQLATNALATGLSVTIAGWGRTYQGSNLSATLRAATFTVLSDANCLSRYPFVARRFISDRHICTQANNRGTCPGDAGGPIIWNNTIVGIVSWVEPCASGHPNVNVRMSSWVNWITGITRVDD